MFAARRVMRFCARCCLLAPTEEANAPTPAITAPATGIYYLLTIRGVEWKHPPVLLPINELAPLEPQLAEGTFVFKP